VGLDRLTPALLGLLVFLAVACSNGGDRPEHLLDGRPAAEFRPVRDSVIAVTRVLERSDVRDCLSQADSAAVASDAAVAERIGVDGRSLTFASRDGRRVYACDGGIDPAGERKPPWCGAVVGEREHGRLLDPRLDVVCVDDRHHALAYAFIEPVARAHWIGVQQDGYVELYEVVAGLPVRVETARGIDLDSARAVFDVTQYDAEGRELVRAKLEAAVAG
jgi:hypothetical protein